MIQLLKLNQFVELFTVLHEYKKDELKFFLRPTMWHKAR